jgi:hypothetical protein
MIAAIENKCIQKEYEVWLIVNLSLSHTRLTFQINYVYTIHYSRSIKGSTIFRFPVIFHLIHIQTSRIAYTEPSHAALISSEKQKNFTSKMRSSILLSTASTLLLLPLSAFASQVNFYWDDNCTPDQFAGAVHPNLGQVAGGPFGARSMYWVEGPSDCIRSLRKYSVSFRFRS